MSEFKEIRKIAKDLKVSKIEIKQNFAPGSQKDNEICTFSIGREFFVKFPKSTNIIGYISKTHFEINVKKI